ncbi:MAG: tRNA (5-methylaminomethyl-2-thiouridine)(34)-methyltransferase MnmD [Bacteroidia bacterium]
MKLITTSDGSHSVFSEKFNADYHSKHGAIQESQHVFIKSGLQYFLQNNQPEALRIFEMGFGTGLNAFLTFLEIQNSVVNVEYTAVDAFPLIEEVYTSLNYAESLNAENNKSDFLKMHQCEWNNFCTISSKFALRKMNAQLQTLNHDQQYHLIFFDAFAHSAQPELWETEIFAQLFNTMKLGGVLVTYSAKGQVRRNLQAAGFQVERIQGPPGKREMLRAIKPLSLQA